MKILELLYEVDDMSCEYCGERELETKKEVETGECYKCAQERFQSERGSQFDGAREEDNEYVECWVDENDNILSEAAVRMFKRVGKDIKRRYRCTTGPKKGKPVSDPKKCATRKDPKKVRHGRKIARTKKGIRLRKTAVMKRTAMSKMVRKMNARLKGSNASSTTTTKVTNTKSAITKKPSVATKLSSTIKAVKSVKSAATIKPKKIVFSK